MSINTTELEQLWGESTFEEKKFAELPDAKYRVKVETARIEASKNGKPMISYDLIIAEGDFKGRHVFHNRLIDTPEHVGWAREELHKLGIAHGTVAEMQAGLMGLIDAVIEITLKTRQTATGEQRQNVYLNKVVVKASEAVAENDNPFM